jgi:hypothetical protein
MTLGNAMTDFGTIKLSCSSLADFSRSFSAVYRVLPPEMQKRLGGILDNYFASYGIEGAYERLKGRTVSQIFAEYEPGDVKEIASGEVDGVRYRLTEPNEKGPEKGYNQG